MKSNSILLILCLFFALPAFTQTDLTGATSEIAFACAPCGCDGDNDFSSQPGNCDHCGMIKVATFTKMDRDAQRSRLQRINKSVAILVFDRVQIIDYTGPYEVFGQAGWNVFTVASSTDMITTAMGMQVVPNYSFDNAPKAEIVVIPGGGVGRHQNKKEVQDWIKKSVEASETTLSVCNGAFFLAATGLLDGKTATTFASLIPSLEIEAPNTKVVRDQRFVDNGKIVTSAGLSSGIDGALHIVSEYYGIGRTQEIATNLEYPWDPDAGYVRAALADKHLSGATGVLRQFGRETLRFQGNRHRWYSQYLVHTNLPAEQLTKLIETQLVKAEAWEKQSGDTATSSWRFKSDEGERWIGKVSVKEAEGKEGLVVIYEVEN